MNHDELFENLLGYLDSLDYVRAREIPNIDLYMDQVTTFMNEHLDKCKRHEEDKILTKTMINNYSKNNLLPPPVKKKYAKEHMFVLIFIYYFKSFLSISDICTILKPLTDRFFGAEDCNFQSIYEEVYSYEKELKQEFSDDLKTLYERAKTSFVDAPEDSKDHLQLFTMICMLGFDVYLKKQMIERITDYIQENVSDPEQRK